MDGKPWLSSYPPGVPAEVPADGFSSLGDFLEHVCREYAGRTAFVSLGRQLSYGALAEESRCFGAFLQSLPELEPGARVALMLPNALQYPVCLFGIWRAGYVAVNCNPLYTPRELAAQLADSGAALIVVLENFAHVVEQAVALLGAASPIRQVVVTGLGDLLGPVQGRLVNFTLKYLKRRVPSWHIPGALALRQALARGRQRVLVPVSIGRHDLALLQYTGGTTGQAKGAMLSHGNLLSNLSQAMVWCAGSMRPEGEFIVTALPLFHIFSLTANCLLMLRVGGTNLLIANPRDIPGLVRELGRYPWTAITGVNTLFNALLHDENFRRLDFRRLSITLGGGMAVQRSVAERWQALTGGHIVEAYGLTETSPAATVNPLGLPTFNGAIGLPLPSTEISIRDDAGREVGPGQAGEICIRGPQVMLGYYRRPQETAEAMTADGYLRTGDIGIMDARGFIRLIDRKKDTILVSGFNVYPNEVEEVISTLPGVREVAAVGVPDAHSGEAVKVFIVRDDPTLSVDTICKHCRGNLTGYKLPKSVEFRSELPKNAVGKILRRALRPSVK